MRKNKFKKLVYNHLRFENSSESFLDTFIYFHYIEMVD
ncbi:hypothetical protein LEP1GSC081_0304 [Leptospira kirschneri str. H1]|uniref:Uncharacterized protein n=1 Tax=Leptospira kirschneri str. H1 TaxID=1049966 RepID=A0A0E2AYE9_9LEPT|nr:hypothetical protein LEP1GSC081_0304 [Leptospira kirschneri str. H1]